MLFRNQKHINKQTNIDKASTTTKGQHSPQEFPTTFSDTDEDITETHYFSCMIYG